MEQCGVSRDVFRLWQWQSRVLILGEMLGAAWLECPGHSSCCITEPAGARGALCSSSRLVYTRGGCSSHHHGLGRLGKAAGEGCWRREHPLTSCVKPS